MAKNDYQKLELMMQDGQSYFGPSSSEAKINSVRKWDQAFRIYATIYTQANPHRASEIWQYIHVIHTAASTYNWDNVAYYDFTFWQLMAAKPWRSWAKTYTQGWNLALRDAHRGGVQTVTHSTTIQNLKKQGGWKDDCCWKYNKNRCTNSSSECRYDHRCTYCGAWNHSFLNCRKCNSKQQAKTVTPSNGQNNYNKNNSSSNVRQ